MSYFEVIAMLICSIAIYTLQIGSVRLMSFDTWLCLFFLDDKQEQPLGFAMATSTANMRYFSAGIPSRMLSSVYFLSATELACTAALIAFRLIVMPSLYLVVVAVDNA